ncbi:putative Ig domain-containing protein [Arcobacter sp. YIC-464]|uniref:beta strand repeat-containing protein n=1 Tax=Arcobacter sp. YIC-464 TaxID=3376631 RepID=UPI003C1D18FB
MGSNIVRNTLISTVVAGMLVGCGGGGSSSSSGGAGGLPSKGPFVVGTTVKAVHLDNSGNEIAEDSATTTIGSDYKFSFSSSDFTWSGPTKFVIEDGQYYNEATGGYSQGTLMAIEEVGGTSELKLNINILTDIAAKTILTKMQSSPTADISTYKTEAKDAVVETFNISLPSGTDLEDLDLTSGSGTTEEQAANTQLLKLTTAILSTDDPEKVIQDLATDLGDGNIDDEALASLEEVQQEAASVDLAVVASKMETTLQLESVPNSDDLLDGTLAIGHGISFTAIKDAARNSSYTATTTIPTKAIYGSSATISIANGEYRINGGAWSTTAGTISNGDTLEVRHTSSTSYSTNTISNVTIGGTKISFVSTTESDPFVADITPNSFDLGYKKGITPGTTNVESNAITVTGVNTDTSISITGGEYQINGGSWTSIAGTVQNGDTVKVRTDASSNFSSDTEATLTIGGIEDTFKVFTTLEDKNPDLISFDKVEDTEISTLTTSGTKTLTGFNTAIEIDVVDEGNNTEYSINGGSFVTTAGTVSVNDTVQVRHTSSSEFSTETVSKLKIGSNVYEFKSNTKADPFVADTTPNAIIFSLFENQELDTEITSSARTITGINTDTAISITNGTYSISSDNGTTWSDFTNEAGTVNLNDQIKVMQTTSSEYQTKTETVLTIGGVANKLVSYTKVKDALVDAFTFTSQSDVTQDTEITSSTITIKGINVEVPVSVDNGVLIIDGIESGTSGTISAGQTLAVKHTSALTGGANTYSKVTVGTYTTTFKSTTAYAAPQISGTPSSSVVTGTAYSFIPSVDSGDEITSWTISGNPSWMKINSVTGEVYGTPANVSEQQSTTGITITATNPGGNDTIVFNLSVDNFVPVLSVSSSVEAVYRNGVSIVTSTEDTSTDQLSYSLSDNTPSFLSIDENGKITNNRDLTTDDVSEYTFGVTVTDSSSATDTVEITLSIIEWDTVNLTPPTISGTPNTTVNEDSSYSFIPTAKDNNSNNLTFAIVNKPTWATFNETTGELSGTPTNDNVGTTSDIVISVTEGNDTVSLDAFNIEVVNTNDTPTAATIPNQSAVQDVSKTIDLSSYISDVDVGDTLTYDVTYADGTLLPSWMEFNVNTAVLTVNATADNLGEHLMKLTAKDASDASVVKEFTVVITDGSTPLNSDVDAAMKIIESIDPELENIDSKLDEAYALVESNTSTEAQIVKLSIELAKILNDSDISSLLVFENNDSTVDLTDTSTLNKIVRAMTKDLIDLDIMDNPIDLSLTMTNKLNAMADKLSLISDEFGTLFTSSDAVYGYGGETMDTNDSKALRAGILSFAAQLKQLSSYQWMADADVAIQTEDIGGVLTEYSNIDIDPASVLNSGSVYKLTSAASTRLPEAKENLVAAANLLLDLPLGYGADENDSSDTGLTQEDKNDMTSIRDAISGTSSYIMSIEDDDEIKEVKIALSKLFDSTTAMDITSLGSNWQNLCSNGDIVSIEEAKINGVLECKVLDWYDSYNDVTYFHYEGSEPEPQTMPTAETSKLDDIVLSITKLDDTILTGQDMIDFIIDGEDNVEAFGMTLANVKDDEKYLVNGNDVKADDYFDDLFINAYKADGIDSRAEAKKNFTTPKSEVKAEISLSDVDILSTDATGPIGRGAMIAFMDNINSAGEKLFVKLDLRDGDTTGKIKYYVAKYDSEWASEVELANGTITSTQTVYEYGESKFAVSIATEGSDIKFNVSKVDDSGNTIESYTEAVVTTDASYDLGIDSVRFRAEVRLSGDDGTLYDQVTTPTKLRVHDFLAVSALETLTFAELTTGNFLSVGDDWYDVLSFNSANNTLSGIAYDYNDSNSTYEEDGTFSLTVTPDSTNNKLASYVDSESGEEGTLTLISTSTVNGYDNVYKTISNMEVTTAATTKDWDRWDSATNHGATDLNSLIDLFVLNNWYTDRENGTKFMLNDNFDVVKATEDAMYGASRTTEVIGTWSEDTVNNWIKVELYKDGTTESNEEVYIHLVNDSGTMFIETSTILLAGYTFTEEFISADSNTVLDTFISDNF